jgi:hypothetical protein
MRRTLFIALTLSLWQSLAVGQNIPTLKTVKKIYVAELGKQPESDLIREKIRLRLAKSKRFTVVDRPEDADATLTGVAGIELVDSLLVGGWGGVSWGRPPYYDPVYGPVYGPSSRGRTTSVGVYGGNDRAPSGTGVFRLIEAKSQDNVWEYEVKVSMGGDSATGAVADKAVKQLLKDARKADGT